MLLRFYEYGKLTLSQTGPKSEQSTFQVYIYPNFTHRT